MCENPNHSLKLLNHLGIKKKLISLHDYNEKKIINKIGKNLKNEVTVLISDAGSPLISDPGYKLVQYCIKNDIYITSIPGPCSIISALQVSGLPTDKFLFLGFAPKTKVSLKLFLKDVIESECTVIFFESNHRILRTLEILGELKSDCFICVCKELTKINEEKIMGSPNEIKLKIKEKSDKIKGEFIIVFEGFKRSKSKEIEFSIDDESEIKKLLKKFSLTDVVEIVHKLSRKPKKLIYKKALDFKK